MTPERLIELFVHRDDVFAQQHKSGAYTPVLREFTAEEAAEHLSGQASYGVYALDTDNTVKWVCFDLDTNDTEAWDYLYAQVVELVAPLTGGDISSILTEFSGNKGLHVWVFLDAPVQAGKVKRWLVRDFVPRWLEVTKVKGWPLEIFPKQDTLPEGGFGNLVKLPFGVHQVSGRPSQKVSRESDGWRYIQPSESVVRDVAPLPAGLVPEVELAPARNRGPRPEGVHTPFPCIDQIMRAGVGKGYRDQSMFHLALYCYGHGLDDDLALEVCNRANEHFDPPLNDREVRRKVEMAYSGRYGGASCGADFLADICPGPCKKGASVGPSRQASGGVLARAAAGTTVEVEVVAVTTDEHGRRLTIAHPDAANRPTLVVSRK